VCDAVGTDRDEFLRAAGSQVLERTEWI